MLHKLPIRKRSFLLIELLLCLLLLSFCLFPLIQPLMNIYKVELRTLQQFQLEREAQNAFCLLKEKLYENAHTWKELSNKKEAVTGKLDRFFLISLPKGEMSYQCSYSLLCRENTHKKGEQTQTKQGVILQVFLSFQSQTQPTTEPIVFKRTLYIEAHQW